MVANLSGVGRTVPAVGRPGCLEWARARDRRAGREDRGEGRGPARRPLGHDRLERPRQSHDLRDVRVRDVLRPPARQGGEAHEAGARERAGRRLDGLAREHGGRRAGDARLRPVGDPPAERPVRAFRRARGAYVARFTDDERTVLAGAALDVASMLGGGDEPRSDDLARPTPRPDDPAIARLLPDASRDDPELAAEFRRLTQADLRATKRGGLLLLARVLTERPGKRPSEVAVERADAR